MGVGLGVSTLSTQSTQPLSWGAKLRLVCADIKLAHSVFALPFALLAAFLVAPGGAPAIVGSGQASDPIALDHHTSIDWLRFQGQLLLVVVCMFFARTWAMVVNRVADRKIDAENPRTARRAFAAGAMSGRDGAIVLTGSALAFVGACALYWVFYNNAWPTLLSWVVLVWIAFYSYTKRFTWLCHVFLGGALAVSPIAAAIAVSADLIAPASVLWLSLMVLLWVAGFDVIYALQDLDFDRERGLRSIPARFGWRGAAWISRVLHLGAVGALVAAFRVEPRFGVLFLIGLGIVVAALAWEHLVLARRGRAGIPMAFFTLNGVVAIALGAFGIADTLL